MDCPLIYRGLIGTHQINITKDIEDQKSRLLVTTFDTKHVRVNL